VLNALIIDSLADASLPMETANPFASVMLPTVLTVGFIAAAVIGSIAWYNSKRPQGWEAKDRPDAIPKIDTSSDPEV